MFENTFEVLKYIAATLHSHAVVRTMPFISENYTMVVAAT